MPKPSRRARRPARESLPAPLVAPPRVSLIERLLDMPHLEHVIPRLQSDVLHRIVRHVGLADAVALLALATPEQLAEVVDRDLWRAPRSGLDEQFDPDRFGEWLDAIVDHGVAFAAKTMASLDPRIVSAGLAQHVRVFDLVAFAPFMSLEGELITPARWLESDLRCEIGGYVIIARRTDAWDAIATVLAELDDAHPDCFTRVMTACRQVSHAHFEEDGLDDLLLPDAQAMFDIDVARESRREREGFVAPHDARAFLSSARHLRLTDTAPPQSGTFPLSRDAGAPIAEASHDESAVGREVTPRRVDDDRELAAVVDVLVDAGVLGQQPRALLGAATVEPERQALVHRLMQVVADRDPECYLRRNGELTQLANVLMSGCEIHGHALEPREASEAALAVCNLGLENWPAAWHGDDASSPGDDFLASHDLVLAFQIGWTVLHDEVAMRAAGQVIEVLGDPPIVDDETREALATLRTSMLRQWRSGTPWRASEEFEVLAILDLTTWTALLGLIAELPVLHAAIPAALSGSATSVRPSDYELISDNRQLAVIHRFLDSLAARLR